MFYFAIAVQNKYGEKTLLINFFTKYDSQMYKLIHIHKQYICKTEINLIHVHKIRFRNFEILFSYRHIMMGLCLFWDFPVRHRDFLFSQSDVGFSSIQPIIIHLCSVLWVKKQNVAWLILRLFYLHNNDTNEKSHMQSHVYFYCTRVYLYFEHIQFL